MRGGKAEIAEPLKSTEPAHKSSGRNFISVRPAKFSSPVIRDPSGTIRQPLESAWIAISTFMVAHIGVCPRFKDQRSMRSRGCHFRMCELTENWPGVDNAQLGTKNDRSWKRWEQSTNASINANSSTSIPRAAIRSRFDRHLHKSLSHYKLRMVEKLSDLVTSNSPHLR